MRRDYRRLPSFPPRFSGTPELRSPAPRHKWPRRRANAPGPGTEASDFDATETVLPLPPPGWHRGRLRCPTERRGRRRRLVLDVGERSLHVVGLGAMPRSSAPVVRAAGAGDLGRLQLAPRAPGLMHGDLALLTLPGPLIHPRHDVSVVDLRAVGRGHRQRRSVGRTRRLGVLDPACVLSLLLAAPHGLKIGSIAAASASATSLGAPGPFPAVRPGPPVYLRIERIGSHPVGRAYSGRVLGSCGGCARGRRLCT